MNDKDISNTLKNIQDFLGDNFINISTRIIDDELSIYVTTKEHEVDKKEIINMCSSMNRSHEIDFPKDNINQFMIHIRDVKNDIVKLI